MHVRIGTFNLENWDVGNNPTLAERIAVTRPQFLRLRADILCLQEIHGQAQPGQPRQLLALQELLQGTPYQEFHRVSTTTSNGGVDAQRNLVILSRFPIASHQQFRNQFAPAPQYRKVTAEPKETHASDVLWERPALHARIQVTPAMALDVINVHLKSKLPTEIDGQYLKKERHWKTAVGFAEGSFLSSMKRVGQALEVRMFIDQLFDQNPGAAIVLAGDFNADIDEVPLAAIRGDVEDTENKALTSRVMVPCERTVPGSARFSLFHRGRPNMLDHLLISRSLLPFYRTTEIHNELLHDESIAFADDKKFPESDHAPVIAELEIT